jgi:hypothetical protein
LEKAYVVVDYSAGFLEAKLLLWNEKEQRYEIVDPHSKIADEKLGKKDYRHALAIFLNETFLHPYIAQGSDVVHAFEDFEEKLKRKIKELI